MTRRRCQNKHRYVPGDRDPQVMWMDSGDGYVELRGGRYVAVDDRVAVTRGADILLHTRLVRLGQQVDRGRSVVGASPSWLALREHVLSDPSLLGYFPMFHRKFEEFVAGGYVTARWKEVVLSPRSRDGGFDVAASKRGRQVLDEVKAYKPSLLVGHPIVRAALGLLVEHEDVDQVRVTTTSWFAPTAARVFGPLIPDKLELRDQRDLLRWLGSVGECDDDTFRGEI